MACFVVLFHTDCILSLGTREREIMISSKELLAQRLEKVNNYPMLLLGAGFSLGAISRNNDPLKLGKELATDLYKHILMPHYDDLSSEEVKDCEFYIQRGRLLDICDLIHSHNLDDERDNYICRTMKGCDLKVKDKASKDYIDFYALATYPWPFIFTLNVDDLVENIFEHEHKKYRVWTRNSKNLIASPNGTTIVKLHGCVDKDREDYVFNQNEYNRFIRAENPLLNRFGDESFSRDVIIVGTQFQENDLKNVINTMISRGCSGKDCHYFFIHPGDDNQELKNSIEEYSHYHHIKWKNKEFLEFLRDRVRIENNKKELLTRNFFTFWNDELEDARNKNKDDHSLYYGRTPIAADFFNSYDIERIDSRNNSRIVDSFRERIKNNEGSLFIVKGNSYVGKTSLALRLLTTCAEEGLFCYYTRKTDIEAIQRLEEYINNTNENERLAVCMEDPVGCYHTFSDLIELGERLKQLVIIAVSDEKEHESKLHRLIKIPNIQEYTISEKMNTASIQLLYSKLLNKNQLGELQRDGSEARLVKAKIKDIGDFIDVLYFAHHGHRFLNHFQMWYQSISDENTSVFDALVVYATIGIKWFPPMLFCDVAETINSKFKYDSFMKVYKEYVLEESGRIRLHGTRLFSEIIKEKTEEAEILEYIRILMRLLGKRIKERDTNELSIMYEKVAKSKHLQKEFGIDTHESIKLLKSTEKECGHLSYYWIQLSILYRDAKMFEEATNAILYAQNVRGYRTYQIAHADAKNYMVWGVNRAKAHDSSANELFEKGREILENLITNKRYYRDAYGFSVHTYVNMTIQFYNNSGNRIQNSEWIYILDILNNYVKQANYKERIMVRLLEQVNEYAIVNGYYVPATKRLINELDRKPFKPSIAFEVDEMPDVVLRGN